MSIENKVKDLILEKYKTLKNFATYCGLPYGTIDGIFRRGFSNSNLDNVLTICKTLGISADGIALGNVVFTSTETNDVQNAITNMFASTLTLDGTLLSEAEAELFGDIITMAIELIRTRRRR